MFKVVLVAPLLICVYYDKLIFGIALHRKRHYRLAVFCVRRIVNRLFLFVSEVFADLQRNGQQHVLFAVGKRRAFEREFGFDGNVNKSVVFCVFNGYVFKVFFLLFSEISVVESVSVYAEIIRTRQTIVADKLRAVLCFDGNVAFIKRSRLFRRSFCDSFERMSFVGIKSVRESFFDSRPYAVHRNILTNNVISVVRFDVKLRSLTCGYYSDYARLGNIETYIRNVIELVFPVRKRSFFTFFVKNFDGRHV